MNQRGLGIFKLSHYYPTTWPIGHNMKSGDWSPAIDFKRTENNLNSPTCLLFSDLEFYHTSTSVESMWAHCSNQKHSKPPGINMARVKTSKKCWPQINTQAESVRKIQESRWKKRGEKQAPEHNQFTNDNPYKNHMMSQQIQPTGLLTTRH